MGAVLVFASSLASLSSGLAGNIDPAFVGLCIAYALMVFIIVYIICID